MPSLPRLPDSLAEPRPIHRAFLFAGGLLLLFLIVQLAPSTGSAASPPDFADTAYETERPRREGYRLFSFGNLLAFGLLAGGGAWALHLRKRAVSGESAGQLFEPLGQLALGQGQQLRLVRCGGEVLLLGVTSGQITLLQRYDEDAFADAPPPPAAAGFADLLQQFAPRSHA